MIEAYDRFDFAHAGFRHDVYRAGTGPAVVIVHGIPGIIPEVVRYAGWVRDAGFTVYLPSLFGTPMKPRTSGYALAALARACISREFSLLAADRSSPVTEWLRGLARRAYDECGGSGVGAIGMCLTGNFTLAMMLEPCVVAPVLAQPSLPFPIGRARRAALHLSPAERDAALARVRAGSRLLGLRFDGDPASPPERFACLRETFGEAFEAIVLDPADANPHGPKPPHGTLTESLVDEPGSPTKHAAERTIAFFRDHVRAADRPG